MRPLCVCVLCGLEEMCLCVNMCVSKTWNVATKNEVTEGDAVYADMCCMSTDGEHVGLLRRHSHGRVCSA